MKKWRSKHVAYETLTKCIEALKIHYSIKKIFLGVEKENIAAVKLYKKMGFKIEKIKMKNKKKIFHMIKYLKDKNDKKKLIS